MVFVICLIVAVIFIFLSIKFEQSNHDVASIISAVIGVPTAVITIIMIIALILAYIDCPGVEAKWQERYASLNTRIEEHMYYPWERGQLIQEVQDWNEDFAAQEVAHNNFWVGIFNPGSIEGLSRIDLTRIN